ncbi:hypothetical protein VKT23_013596 [Stygiomarasmius scandens]|uniref:MYND-type domain-containing protein n=1 Tax=Marasmiellus scandens TaxID=2682957 RepID=A0ABR1J385_9AGAR
MIPGYHVFSLSIHKEAYTRLRWDLPSSPLPDSLHQMELVGRAIDYLVNEINNDLDKDFFRDRVKEDREQNWPDLWRWTSFLLQNFVIDCTLPTIPQVVDIRERLIPSAFLLLNNLHLSCPPDVEIEVYVHQKAEDAPDLFPTCLGLWLYCMENLHPLEYSSMRPVHTILQLTDSGAPLFPHFRDTLARTPNLWKISFRYIAMQVQEDEIPYPNLETRFYILSRVYSYIVENCPLLDIMEENHATKWLSFALKHFSRAARRKRFAFSEETQKRSVECIKRTLTYIYRAIEKFGVNAAIAALQEDILLSMFNVCHLFAFDEETRAEDYEPCLNNVGLVNYYCMVLESLRPMMYYHKVANLFTRSFKRISSQRELYSQFLEITSTSGDFSALGEAWRSILTRSSKMKKQRRVFRQFWDMKAICNNSECRSEGKIMNSTLHRCSRCMLKIYCSEECQKNDWKNHGHRKLCDPASQRSRLSFRVSDSDRSFLQCMVIAQLRFERKVLIEKKQRLFSNLPSSSSQTKAAIYIVNFAAGSETGRLTTLEAYQSGKTPASYLQRDVLTRISRMARGLEGGDPSKLVIAHALFMGTLSTPCSVVVAWRLDNDNPKSALIIL